MKKLPKLFLAIFLLALCISIMSVTAFAADDTYTYNNGELTILTADGFTAWEADTGINPVDVKSIVIGANVTEIQSAEFQNNTIIESVTFNGDIELSDFAFYNCPSLRTVIFEGESTLTDDAFGQCPNIETITFGGKTSLSGSVFLVFSGSPNTKLTELVLPEGSLLSGSVFGYYTALESVTFEGDIELSGNAFTSCTGLKTTTFMGDAELSGFAFYLCQNLETVTFDGESTLTDDAFGQCPNIETVTFEEKTELSERSFSALPSDPNIRLTELVLPEGSLLSGSAFGNCTALKTVTLKDGAELGAGILAGCTALEEIYFEAKQPQIFESLTFTNFDPANITLYVVNYEKYRSALILDKGNDSNVHYNSEFVSCLKRWMEKYSNDDTYNYYTLYYTLSFNTNGGSSISSVTRIEGTTISLASYTPTREGYEFTGWYSNAGLTNKITSVTLNGNKTVYAGWKSNEEINPNTGAWVNPFIDVFERDWFFDDVRFAYENDLMKGTSSNTFSPNVTTTRCMIVTVLYRLEGEPTVYGTCPFDDVESGMYYEDAIIWAAQNDIVNGYGNAKFGPEDDITREQMAAILYRYAEHMGYDISGKNSLAGFNDVSQISSYALDNVKWAVDAGLIGGMGDGTLAPQGNATRSQIAAILHRFIDKFVK